MIFFVHVEKSQITISNGNEETHDENLLNLYEAKFFHQFDHRWAEHCQGETVEYTVALKKDVRNSITTMQMVPGKYVRERLQKSDKDGNVLWEWKRNWLLVWRDITNATNERTVISAVIPFCGVANNAPVFLFGSQSALDAALLSANLNSFVLDYFARFGVSGTHLNFFIIKQLPFISSSDYSNVIPWNCCSKMEWVVPRILELAFSAYDLNDFAGDCGYHESPFPWHEGRRFLLRCELDAAYFHFYGIERDDIDYIMETFPIVKRKDEKEHGEYRTKRMILEIYDEMAEAARTGGEYQTRLDPPPANGWVPKEIS